MKLDDLLSVSARNEDVLLTAEQWRKEGREVALATVVNTWGSSPRPIGSHLIVDDRENFLGSISGGCVESSVIVEALAVMRTGKASLLEFGVADETAWNVGLACGGKIAVYIEKVD